MKIFFKLYFIRVVNLPGNFFLKNWSIDSLKSFSKPTFLNILDRQIIVSCNILSVMQVTIIRVTHYLYNICNFYKFTRKKYKDACYVWSAYFISLSIRKVSISENK